MEEEITITASRRDSGGSRVARRLRRAGTLPAVVYGDGKEARMIELNAHDLDTTLRHHSGESLMVNLSVDGQPSCKALLREIQHHPVSGKVLHVDFNEVSMTKKLKISVAVELVGTPVGVSQQGGVLEHLVHSIEVECLPADLVQHFQVDVSALGVGERAFVSDVQIEAGKHTVLTPGDIAVASVAAPRVSEEPAASEEAEAGAQAYPEVI